MLKSIFSAVLLVASLVAGAQPKTLSVGWEEYPPIQISDTGDTQGIDIEIVRALLKTAGYAIIFQKLPWQRQLMRLEHGDLDIAIAASITEDRKPYAEWTDTYRIEQTVLWGLDSGAPRVKNLRSLLGAKSRIGYLRGSTFPGEFAELVKNPQFEKLLYPVNGIKQALGMMRAGRLEYVIEDMSTFNYLLANSPGRQVVGILNINADDLHFMVSKKTIEKDPTLISKLNAALAQLIKSKEIESILVKYGSKS